MKEFINKILSYGDIRITRKSFFDTLVSNRDKYRDYELAALINNAHLNEYFKWLPYSRSQLRQDLFVLSELGFKQNGFFVEFGATNGIDLSNTYMLEKFFNWNGILAEPARIWHATLLKNRDVSIETSCVWKTSNTELVFNEVKDPDHNGELSTIDAFSNSDELSKARRGGEKYVVNTISLADMLKKYEAPREIDYLSIDTEGSEYEILKDFDISKYNIKVITCEHNYTSAKEKLHDLFVSWGYEQRHSNFSRFDAWYVKLE